MFEEEVFKQIKKYDIALRLGLQPTRDLIVKIPCPMQGSDVFLMLIILSNRYSVVWRLERWENRKRATIIVFTARDSHTHRIEKYFFSDAYEQQRLIDYYDAIDDIEERGVEWT